MPCTYSVVDLKERERRREEDRMREEERRKAEVERKKRALLIALEGMGFSVSKIESLDDGQTFIEGEKE